MYIIHTITYRFTIMNQFKKRSAFDLAFIYIICLMIIETLKKELLQKNVTLICDTVATND